MGRVTIETRSENSNQKEYMDERYQYFVFVPHATACSNAVAKEIARLSAACQVNT
jgi:hypothetical protein